jgi:hypothetical protein
MRRFSAFAFFVLFATTPVALVAAPQSPQPATAEQMLDRCKAAPDICKAIAAAEADALKKKGDACIPANVSTEDLAERVIDTAADAVDEAPDALKDLNYTTLIDQIIVFLWDCKERPVS